MVEFGIYEGKKDLLDLGVKTSLDKIYIANHQRAILDMLYDYLTEVGIIAEIDNASFEYLKNKKSAVEMLNKSELILKYLNKEQITVYYEWLKKEKERFVLWN